MMGITKFSDEQKKMTTVLTNEVEDAISIARLKSTFFSREGKTDATNYSDAVYHPAGNDEVFSAGASGPVLSSTRFLYSLLQEQKRSHNVPKPVLLSKPLCAFSSLFFFCPEGEQCRAPGAQKVDLMPTIPHKQKLN